MRHEDSGSAPPFGGVTAALAKDDALASVSACSMRDEVRGIAGMTALMVEERVHPVWLRAGTEDVDRAIMMLDLQRRGLKCAHEPRRIIEIGAGAGYRSVALASEYPGAEILSVESDPALQRVALLNTLGYDNITYRSTAVGIGEERYGYFSRTGAQGRPALLSHPAGTIKSTTLEKLLQYHRFGDADTLIITPDAASAPLLAAPLPGSIRLIAVETGGLPLPEETARRYPLSQFVTIISGDYVLLYRRATVKIPPGPRSVAVFAPDGPARFLRVENVMPGGFFALGQGGFRLHPNHAGGAVARVTLSVENRDYTELQVSLRLVLEQSPQVRFTVKMLTENGTVLASGVETLRGAQPRALVLQLPEHQGRCEVVFTTELTGTGISNAGAWAEIISATLV